MRRQFGKPRARTPVSLELEDRRRGRETRLVRRHPREPLSPPDRIGQVLAAILFKLRLWVEEIELRRRARLVEVNHALCLRREVWQTGQTRLLRQAALFEQRRQRRDAHPGATAAEEMAASHQQFCFA